MKVTTPPPRSKTPPIDLGVRNVVEMYAKKCMGTILISPWWANRAWQMCCCRSVRVPSITQSHLVLASEKEVYTAGNPEPDMQEAMSWNLNAKALELWA